VKISSLFFLGGGAQRHQDKLCNFKFFYAHLIEIPNKMKI
jgi:hypothetical protein